MGIIYKGKIYKLVIIFITLFSISVNAKKCSYEEEVKIEKEVNKYLNLLKCNFEINYMNETDEILQKCIELENECEKEYSCVTSDGKKCEKEYKFSSCYSIVYQLCDNVRADASVKAEERGKNYNCKINETCEPVFNYFKKWNDSMEEYCNLYGFDYYIDDNTKKDACRAERSKDEIKYLNSLFL